jgi:WD40 repeat protein
MGVRPTGEWIAVTLLDNPGTIQVFDADNLSLFQTLSGHGFLTRSLAWSPDSQYLACSGDYGDDTVQIWNVNTGTTFRVLDGFGAGWLAWSPDGTRLAGSRYRPAVEIWDVQAGVQLATVTASDEVSTGTWGSDSGTVIYGTDNSTIATLTSPPPIDSPTNTPPSTPTTTPLTPPPAP